MKDEEMTTVVATQGQRKESGLEDEAGWAKTREDFFFKTGKYLNGKRSQLKEVIEASRERTAGLF